MLSILQAQKLQYLNSCILPIILVGKKYQIHKQQQTNNK
jgi:hypothetical protein